jgi:hypothetical protein
MNAQTLIREAQTEGVAIMVSPEGGIILSGKQADREKWASILKPHRDEVIRLLTPPMTATEETAIRCWLTVIGENDPGTAEEVIENCRRDTEARRYFLRRARELVPT